MLPIYKQGQKLPITVLGHEVQGEVIHAIDTKYGVQMLELHATNSNGDCLKKITYNDDKTLMQ